MNTEAIRQQLHEYVDLANDRKISAIYTIIEEDIKEIVIEYSPEFRKELDKRVKYYMDGGKMVSPREMNTRLQAIRKKRSRK